MFNLEQAIASWRRELSAGLRSPEALDELESHLRDELEQQLRAGLEEEAAFERAMLKMGAARQLHREFSKCGDAPPDRRRFFQCLYILSALLMILINGWTAIALDLSGLERIEVLSVLVSVCFYLVAMPLLPRFVWPSVSARVVRVIKIVTFLFSLWPLLTLLSVFHLTAFEIGNVTAMVLWSVYAGIMIGALAAAFHGRSSVGGCSGGFLPPFASVPHPMPPPRPMSPRGNALKRERVEAL